MTTAGAGELVERVDVPLVVHASQLVTRCVAPRAAIDDVAEMRVVDPGEDRLDATDAFGVAAAGVVRVGSGRDDDQQAVGHA
jgi:hypothetical protein